MDINICIGDIDIDIQIGVGIEDLDRNMGIIWGNK